MKITRNVIIDLLPLYMADEVSADTRALVDSYLVTDPELAKIAEQSHTDLPLKAGKISLKLKFINRF